MQTITRHRSTVEYLEYTFDSVTVGGAPVPAPTTYDIAAPVAGQQPTTWNPAPWLAGPLTPGLYDIYIRFTDTPEIPSRQVAHLRVT